MSMHDSVTKRNRRPESDKRVDYTARTGDQTLNHRLRGAAAGPSSSHFKTVGSEIHLSLAFAASSSFFTAAMVRAV